MINSMTAFGRAVGSAGGKNFVCEMKSVNNRFLDLSVRLPRNYSYFEDNIRKYIKEESGITRGKIDISVSVELVESEGVIVEPDMAYARSYYEALKRLSDELSLKDDITVSRIAQNKDVFIVKKPEEDAEKEWAQFFPFFEEAVLKFKEARTAEGENLRRDLLIKRGRVSEIAAEIKRLSEKNTVEYRARLEARLRNIIGELDISMDESRILTECAIFADKIAVDEELVRLSSHLKAFDDALSSDEPVGRKLDFILQEINREINTSGSKSNDSEIAKLVVEAKCEIEKIREQIQNLE